MDTNNHECSKCSVVKAQTEFYKNSARASKRNSSCKDCQRESRMAQVPNPPVAYNIECSSCFVTKDADYFYKNKGAKNGRNSICRRCVSKAAPTYAQDTKKQERVARNKNLLHRYKTICGGCSDCGFNNDPKRLYFIHLSLGTKHVINASWGPKRIEKELSQCKVLCSECYTPT